MFLCQQIGDVPLVSQFFGIKSGPGIDLLNQISKNHPMEGEKKIPVEAAQESFRREISSNDQPPFVHGGHDLEFQPCLSRYLHLSPQKKPLIFT